MSTGVKKSACLKEQANGKRQGKALGGGESKRRRIKDKKRKGYLFIDLSFHSLLSLCQPRKCIFNM